MISTTSMVITFNLKVIWSMKGKVRKPKEQFVKVEGSDFFFSSFNIGWTKIKGRHFHGFQFQWEKDRLKRRSVVTQKIGPLPIKTLPFT